MGEYGFKVSKVNLDVNQAELKNLLFQSDKIALKIFKEGETTVTITPGDTSGTKDIDHELGYPPFYLAYCNVGSTRRHMGFSGITLTEDTDFNYFGGRANSNRVRFYVARNGIAGTSNYQVYYYIFVNSMETG